MSGDTSNWSALELSTKSGDHHCRIIRSNTAILIKTRNPQGVINADCVTHKTIERARILFSQIFACWSKEYDYEVVHAEYETMPPAALPGPATMEKYFVDRWRSRTIAGLVGPPTRWVLFTNLKSDCLRDISAGFILDQAAIGIHYLDPVNDLLIASASNKDLLTLGYPACYDLGPVQPGDENILDLALAAITSNLGSPLNFRRAMDTARGLYRLQANRTLALR